MLTFLPTPYPDELWYSVLCRYHVRSGNVSQRKTAEDIFARQKQKVSVELATDVQFVLDALRTPFLSAREVLVNHTLLPFYARFWRAERKAKVCAALCGKDDRAVHSVGIYKMNGTRYKLFRYCPVCFIQDIELYGEPYWHRQHQMPDIRVCIVHKCWLIETDVMLRDSNNTFRPALTYMEQCKSMQGQPSEQELNVTKLFVENLTTPFKFQEDGSVYRDVFTEELKRHGKRSLPGKRTFVHEVCKEMRIFFESFVTDEDLGRYRMRLALSKSRQDVPKLILLAAYFYGFTLDDLLTVPKQDCSVQSVKMLYAKGYTKRYIAEKYGTSVESIKKVVGYDTKPERVLNKLDRLKNQIDWASLDSQTVPRIKILIKSFKQGKPQNINFGTVAKGLGDVSAWELYHMPRCTDLVKQYYEPIEVTWEKRISWAQRELEQQGKNPSQDAVFTLAGIDKTKFESRVGGMYNGLSE